jgi:hypothetical protein
MNDDARNHEREDWYCGFDLYLRSYIFHIESKPHSRLSLVAIKHTVFPNAKEVALRPYAGYMIYTMWHVTRSGWC